MRIVVVGGVAGGMSCAARARRLDEDAQIVVLEAGEHVSFANCGLPYYVGGEIDDEQRLLVQTPASLRASLNLDVRTRSEVIGLDTARHSVSVRSAGATTQLTYDALVLAPGAVALRPPIDGLDSPRVRTLRTVDDAIDLQAIVSGGARHGWSWVQDSLDSRRPKPWRDRVSMSPSSNSPSTCCLRWRLRPPTM